MEKKLRFTSYAILLTLFLLPNVAYGSSGNIISSPAVQAFQGAFGSPGIFVFLFFVIVAFMEGYFHIPWPIAMELFFVTFIMIASFDLFSYQIAVIIWVMMFMISGYGFSKIFADLIFA